ncbi:hypothetical protein FAUST_1446 [Fusarium austroamericanum]|uniref:Uncharacterized protein n=1 Tax=Fusarium austroamericanum TaxID=282268 RepID=A0AAN6C8H0_FUSAU|nr:hypothetical protein FAUST_1446 [Fusarium austroamericanum]
MTSPANAREIFTVASECSVLFQKCAHADQKPPKAQKDVALLSKDFEAWCFNLGVFAAPTASLDQTLRYSDEIRGFVMQLLLALRRNLEFINIYDPPEDPPRSTTPRPNETNHNAVEKLQGSIEEALRAISAVLQRLDRLGATIRKYSASSLSSRVKAFAEQDHDEEYRLLAKNIVVFKYPTAPSSLHAQLAESMAHRRQRLRYIRQHQQKTTPKDRQDSRTRKHHEKNLSHPKSTELTRSAPKDRAAVLRNQAVSRPRGNPPSEGTETTPSTTAWTVRPTSSAMERVRRDGSKSVISSSKASTTRMVGDLNDYPEPPTYDQWSQDPKCSTCWRQLLEAELKGKKWRRHIDTDCESYICISEDCKQPLQFFSDLNLWENHMRSRHSTEWTRLVHKPTIWICDVDHDDEEFQDHESFQEHLCNKHSDLSEAERKAVATLSVASVTRAKHTCPLCGYDSTAEQDSRSEATSSTPQQSDMDQLARLAKHVAGHLRCLAFHALDHLDSDQGSVSEPGSEITSHKARSRSGPPSGLKDLDDVSSGFADDDNPRSVSAFDELETRQEGDGTPGENTLPQIVSLLPEFEKDWGSVAQTRSVEEDPILHKMMAYSLWDRAFDNLKKMEPLLVEKHEILLSKELMKDPEGDSKEIVNQFRNASIHERRALLNTIMDKLLERMLGRYRVSMSILDWITDSAGDFPKASLPWVGFCLVLVALQDVGIREDAGLASFASVASKLRWYSTLESIFENKDWTSSETPKRDLIQLEKDVLRLCQYMLELQLRVIASSGQLAKSGDWGELLSAVESLEIHLIKKSLGLSVHAVKAELDRAEQTAASIFEATVTRNHFTGSTCFCVPFNRDPGFVDRRDILIWLEEQYTGSAGRMALVGMGGFGYGPPREHPSRTTFVLTDKSKSQVAIEFVYHIHRKSPQTSVFWVHASSKLRFEEAYRSIADTLQLPRRNNPDVDVLRLVRDWMQTEEAGSWLMVLDNVDDVNLFYPRANASGNKAANQPTEENAIISSDQWPLAAYLPKYSSGTILITSRSIDAAEKLTGSHKAIYRVSAMDEIQGLRLLQNKLNGDFNKDAAVDLLRALDYIPLAITQAAAYINRRAPRASVQTYLDAFRESDKKKGTLLNRDTGDLRRDESMSNSVVTTWQVIFEQIRRERLSAAKLLSFISFFNPHGIPMFVLYDYNTGLTDDINRVTESDDFEDDLHILRGYSLVSVTAAQDMCEVHSLVQFCVRAWISIVDDTQRWKRVFLQSMSRHFPSGAFETWPTCQLLLPHIESVLDERPPDEDLQNWARLLTNCASYMLTIGNYMVAEKLGGKAVETMTEVLGEEHSATLTSMANLASTFRYQGRWKEAEELDIGVVEIRKRVLGEEHPDTLTSMANLASTFRYQGRWKEAEELDIGVVEIRKRVLGEEHPDTLTSMANLAIIWKEQGRWKEAEELEVGVMETRKRVLGEEHPDTLTSMTNLASIYGNQGRWKEAEELGIRTMEIMKIVLGEEHPDTLTSMANLAIIWKKQGRTRDALALMRSCIVLRERVLGTEHPHTASLAVVLAEWHQPASVG